MKDFPQPTPGVPFLAQASAVHLDQLHDRIQSELQHHVRSTVDWYNGAEPNVELSLDEARLTIRNLSKAARLLRAVSEGSV